MIWSSIKPDLPLFSTHGSFVTLFSFVVVLLLFISWCFFDSTSSPVSIDLSGPDKHLSVPLVLMSLLVTFTGDFRLSLTGVKGLTGDPYGTSVDSSLPLPVSVQVLPIRTGFQRLKDSLPYLDTGSQPFLEVYFCKEGDFLLLLCTLDRVRSSREFLL